MFTPEGGGRITEGNEKKMKIWGWIPYLLDMPLNLQLLLKSCPRVKGFCQISTSQCIHLVRRGVIIHWCICNRYTYCNNITLIIHNYQYLCNIILIKVPNMKDNCCCLFVFNVSFNNFSVASQWCLIAALFYSAALLKTLGMISHPVTLSWHWVDQS